MKSGIYKITNDITGKFYIGSTKDTDKRWYDHKRELTLNTHTNPKLQHSWNKHGEDKFSFVILEEIEPDQQKLFEREQYYLDTLKSYDRNVGYNICPIASGGDNITHNPNRDAFIEKMKIINHGESNGMYGKNHTDDTIEKQKDKAKGRYTLEWFVDKYGKREGKKQYGKRRVMLKNRKINYSYPNPRKGKTFSPMSDETKQKLSDSKHKMRTQRKFLVQDIKSEKYTSWQLCEKYSIGLTAIKYYKHKLRLAGKL